MATYRGKPVCSCLEQWLPVFEALIGREVDWFQLVGDADASKGFHRGGGSADCAPLSEAELRAARNMGAAAWNRWWKNNFHAHLRLNGCPHNAIGQPQVDDLNEGRDGTGPLYDNAGVRDNGPRDGVRWPLRTWRQGITWARTKMKELDVDEKTLRKIIREEVGAELAEHGLDDLARMEKVRSEKANKRHELLKQLRTQLGDVDDDTEAILAQLAEG